MSLYNMIHGMNPMSDLLLAALGLTRDKVGRFRDCYWNGEHICVYTRNGGGNRECWHGDDPKNGKEDCGGEPYQHETDESVWLTEAEGKEKGYTAWNVFSGNKRLHGTGKRIVETRYTCGGPHSEKCSCPGCIINYRLPLHEAYSHDSDDDYDCTYATIYFKPSEALKAVLAAIPAADASPEQKWESFLERLRSGTDDPQIERVFKALAPTMDALAGAAGR